MFVADKGDGPQTFGGWPSDFFWSVAARSCITLPGERGSERERQASSHAVLIYSPFGCHPWEKKELWPWRRTQPCGVKERQPQPGLGWPEPSRALRRRKVLPLAALSPTLRSLLPPPCVPLAKGETILLCQAGNYCFQPRGFLPAVDCITFKTG